MQIQEIEYSAYLEFLGFADYSKKAKLRVDPAPIPVSHQID